MRKNKNMNIVFKLLVSVFIMGSFVTASQSPNHQVDHLSNLSVNSPEKPYLGPFGQYLFEQGYLFKKKSRPSSPATVPFIQSSEKNGKKRRKSDPCPLNQSYDLIKKESQPLSQVSSLSSSQSSTPKKRLTLAIVAARLNDLEKQNEKLAAENKKLEARIAELENSQGIGHRN